METYKEKENMKLHNTRFGICTFLQAIPVRSIQKGREGQRVQHDKYERHKRSVIQKTWKGSDIRQFKCR